MDVVYLLERLEELLSSGSRVPFSSRVLIDEQECLDVVDQIRHALPEELKMARQIVKEREQLIAEAHERANRILERAELQIAQRVDEHAVVRAAEERAQSLLRRAEQEAAEIRRQADDYAFRVLSSLDRRLRQVQHVVQEGLAELRPGEEPADDL